MRDFTILPPIQAPSYRSHGKSWYDYRCCPQWFMSVQVDFESFHFGMHVLGRFNLDALLLEYRAKPNIASYLLGANTMRDTNFHPIGRHLSHFTNCYDYYDISDDRLDSDGCAVVVGLPIGVDKIHGMELDVLWLSDFDQRDRELTAYMLGSSP